MEPTFVSRRVLPFIALVVTPIALVALAAGGLGVTGLGGYLVIFFGLLIWNFFATWRALSNRRGTYRGSLAPYNLAFLAGYVLVLLVWGPGSIYMWGSERALWAIAYGVAATMTIVQLWRQADTRRLRNHLFAAYNVLGTLAVGAWALADVGSPGIGPLTVVAQGWGITQALLFIWGAYFAPILFLPPLLVYEPHILREEEADQQVTVDPDTGIVRIASEESLAARTATALGTDGAIDMAQGKAAPSQAPRRGPLRRASSFAFDSLMGGFVVVLLVFSAVGAVNLASWNDLGDPAEAEYGRNADLEFAAIGRAFTDRPSAVEDWEGVVELEIIHARRLGLDYIRYDLQKELIDDGQEMERLAAAIASIRDGGLDVILAPFGSAYWESDPPSFDALVEEIQRETYLLVDLFEPAWVLPFFEPNGQVRVNLGGYAPVHRWMEVINETGSRVRQLSNVTRVLIEVAIEPEQGIELVEGLSEEGMAIDAIGVDLYPLSASDLDKIDPYREAATNDRLGFWLGEFGVESVLSGHKGQARALSRVLVRATSDLRADGICVWALLDDTVLPSNLGLVARNGDEKEAHRVLRQAIEEIRG